MGAAICTQLSAEGHDITVIDTEPSAVNEIANVCDVIGLVGNGADISVLRTARQILMVISGFLRISGEI